MKTISISSVTAALGSMLSAPAFALEAPADNAPPPPPVVEERAVLPPEIKLGNPPAKPGAEVGFLGVKHGNVPELLASHLDLKSGEGAVVLSMEPDSPAALAGIAVDDVITHVAGQAVDSQTGLAQRISDHRPSAVVNVVVIRKGKPTSLDVTLGARPAQLPLPHPRQLNPLALNGLPEDLAEQVRAAIEANVKGVTDLQASLEQLKQLDQLKQLEQLEQLKTLFKPLKQLDPKLLGNLGAGGMGAGFGGATIIINDQKGSVERRANNGSVEITVKDPNSEIIWTGPWNTDKEKAAAPEEIAKRIGSCSFDQMNPGNGQSFFFHNLNPQEDEDN